MSAPEVQDQPATGVVAAPPRPLDPQEPRPTGRRTPGLGKTLRDMVLSMAVVLAVLLALLLLNYRTPEDPVRQVDGRPVAEAVAAAVDYEVRYPQDPQWRATSARYEPTAESQDQPVWFTGGVLDDGREFVSLSQSSAQGPDYLAEQTYDGVQSGQVEVAGVPWQVWQQTDHVSLVRRQGGVTTVVAGTVEVDRLVEFLLTAEPVTPR